MAQRNLAPLDPLGGHKKFALQTCPGNQTVLLSKALFQHSRESARLGSDHAKRQGDAERDFEATPNNASPASGDSFVKRRLTPVGRQRRFVGRQRARPLAAEADVQALQQAQHRLVVEHWPVGHRRLNRGLYIKLTLKSLAQETSGLRWGVLET